VAGSLTKIKGRHTIQFGGEYRRDTYNYAEALSPLGTFAFSTATTSSNPIGGVGGDSTASMLLGYSTGVQQRNVHPSSSVQTYPALYLQDQFRATHKLTLNYGVRWEQDGPFIERHNRLSILDPNAPTAVKAGCTTLPSDAQTGPLAGQSQLCMTNVGDLGLAATPQHPKNYDTTKSWRQWSPHLGFAYAAGSKTVIRGGFGLFWISPDVNPENAPNFDFTNFIGTPMVSSVDGGFTPCMTPTPTGCTPGPLPAQSNTFNMYDPYPNGILTPPGRNPIYQTLAYGHNPMHADMPNVPPAYYQQWNLDVQRELGNGTLIDVAYAASTGKHLPDTWLELDVMPDKYLALGNSVLDLVPNPFYGLFQTGNPAIQNVTALNTSPTIQLLNLLTPYPQYGGYEIANPGWSSSNYQSLQMKLEKRMKGSGTLLVGYTLSKTLASGDIETLTGWLEPGGLGGPGLIQNWNDLKADKALSAYDAPQRFVVSCVLDVPVGRGKRFLPGVSGAGGKLISGWGIQGITSYQRGFPLIIWGGGTVIGPNNVQRPMRIGTSSGKLSGSPESRLNEWFDTSVFGFTQPWTYGNESRQDPVLRSDGIRNWDFSLVKDTRFGPDNKLGLQFRAEVFNLFNTPQFGPPNTACCSNANQPSYDPAFGTVTSTVNLPRLIQFALRFQF
jgi:hypothetical protein